MANEVKETKATVETPTKAVEAPTKAEAPKKVRKPREKVRSVEETASLPLAKLTDKEKDNLIKSLKEENNLLRNKADSFKLNAASAFDQTRQMEEQYKAMEQYYRDQLKYVDAQVNAFHAAINQAVKGGIA